MKKIILPVVMGCIFSSFAYYNANSTAGTATNVLKYSLHTTYQTTIPLSASQEVPVNDSKASGTADVSYNKTSHMLTYTVNWQGLTGVPTMSHIHGPAPKGVNAGVKKDLTPVLKKSTEGSFTDSLMIDGSKINEDSLMAGLYYFNIHTPAHPGGEIRGQIELNK